MSKGRILVIDADEDIRRMMEIYFTGQDYEVEAVFTGAGGLAAVRRKRPSVIVIADNLPDMRANEFVRTLREPEDRADIIPALFLEEKKQRNDIIGGPFICFDDYVTKPFDIEEVKLRIQNAIIQSNKPKQIDPISGFPRGHLIEGHLRDLMQNQRRDWVCSEIRLDNFEAFSAVYGWQAKSEVIKVFSQIIRDIQTEFGKSDDFVGCANSDYFILINHGEDYQKILDELVKRFGEMIPQFYSEEDRKRGFVLLWGEEIPLLSLSFGLVDMRETEVKDIRELTELASDDRRRRMESEP